MRGDRKLCEATAERLGWEFREMPKCFLMPEPIPAPPHRVWFTLDPADPIVDMIAAARVLEAAFPTSEKPYPLKSLTWDYEGGELGFEARVMLNGPGTCCDDPNPLRAAMRLVTGT